MKKVLKLLVFLAVVSLVAGCNFGMNKIVSTPGHLTSLQRVDNLDSSVAIKLNNFGLNLYNKLYKKDKNIFISPASIYLALGMTYNGANGDTATEMANVIGADNMSLDEFNKLCRDLQYLMLGYDESKFELANSIWIRDTYKDFIKDDFITRNKTYFGAMISSLDFDDPKSKDTINNWVKDNTKGRIEKAIDEDRISPLTVMYLINTIYFKADWQTPFLSISTEDRNFQTPSGIKKVKMMNKIDNIGYVENDDLQGVLLPYKDDKTAMFVLLPKDNINELNLDSNNLNNLITKMKNNNTQVNLSMPKVKMEYAETLNNALNSLGMINAFNFKADFSQMATNAIDEGLHISNVTHKSFLAIDEEGTEAAAMTKVEMRDTALPEIKYTVNVDHPFVLGIVDKKSNAILFIGSVFDPGV